MLGPVVLFYFLLFPVSEGLKYDMGVSFFVAYFVRLVSYLEDLADFCLADLVLICLG